MLLRFRARWLIFARAARPPPGSFPCAGKGTKGAPKGEAFRFASPFGNPHPSDQEGGRGPLAWILPRGIWRALLCAQQSIFQNLLFPAMGNETAPSSFFEGRKKKSAPRHRRKKGPCIKLLLTALSFQNSAAHRAFPSLVRVGHAVLLFPLPLHGAVENCAAFSPTPRTSGGGRGCWMCLIRTNPAEQPLCAARRGIEARFCPSLHPTPLFLWTAKRPVSFSPVGRKRNGGRKRSPKRVRS